MSELLPEKEVEKFSVEGLEASHGATLVGLNFNPSNDETVDKLKRLFAQAINIVSSDIIARNDGGTHEKFQRTAVDNIITAQMWAVKTVTFKS